MAQELALLLHMAGARLLNACAASGISPASYARPFDSAWLDLSKGLGCPIGAVLAGSRAFIEQADRWKHRFGGAMRQAGIIAAAGLYALDHHVDRLIEDHRNALLFAAQICGLPGVRMLFDQTETNLVFFDVSGSGRAAAEIAYALAGRGVRIGVESQYVMRAAFHLDISTEMSGTAAKALEHVLKRPA